MDTPQGEVRLRALYDNDCQINLINQNVVLRYGLPTAPAHASRRPIARFLDSNQMTIWDAHDLTVTTSDS
jgi:hypothetical protein